MQSRILFMTESHHHQIRWAQALLWLVPALWTVNYIVARKAPGVIGPHLLAIAGPELWRERAAVLRVWWQYLILGALGMLICGAWVYQGARSTQAINIALIYAASPVLIGLGAAWWLGERIGPRQKLGVALALAGVFNVVVKGQWAQLANVQFVPGDLWIVAATVAWAAYALLQKLWPSSLSATARLAAICMGGVFVLLPSPRGRQHNRGSRSGAYPPCGWCWQRPSCLVWARTGFTAGLKKSWMPAAWPCRFTWGRCMAV